MAVYTKQTGSATLSIVASQATGLNQLLLTDNTTGIITDLLVSDYSFTANAGTMNNRFLISTQRIATSQQSVEVISTEPHLSVLSGKLLISNINAKAIVRVYDLLGRLIDYRETTHPFLEIPLRDKGIFTVSIQMGGKSLVQKILNN